MVDKEIKEKWEKTQLEWDDKDFLEKKANALMKKRWQRLNLIVSQIVISEVINKKEYIYFLDVGAGRADFYKYIKDVIKKYVGIEPSSKMLEYEVNEEFFELKKMSGEELSDMNLYDICLIKESLDHCYEPEKVIKNVYNALKDDGLIIITLTNRDAYYKLLFKKLAKKIEQSHIDHLYNFNEDDVKQLLEKNSFKIGKVISLNYLRLPYFLEDMLGSLPQKIVFFILEIFDKIGRLFLKGKGGSFIILARKIKKEEL